MSLTMRERYAAALICGLLAGFVLGGAFGSERTLFGPVMASWVQALGSFAALSGIWFAARLDRAKQAEVARQRVADFEKALLDAIYLAETPFEALRKAADGAPGNLVIIAVMARMRATEWAALEQLLRVSITDWPSPLHYTRAARLLSAIQLTVGLANEPGASFWEEDSTAGALKAALADLGEAAYALKNTLRA